MSTSKRYNELRAEIVAEYKTEPADPRNQYWWTHFAPLWRNRVGVPRLTAEAASAEANGLLGSINLSTFRNDPDLWNKLLDAREAVGEFTQALGVDNYRRFLGEEKP
jgi:hypothetical protein